MADIVAKGRKPDVIACAYCHTPTGQGRPENAPIAGLPAGYFREQLLDMRSGARKPVGPAQFAPNHAMAQLAQPRRSGSAALPPRERAWDDDTRACAESNGGERGYSKPRRERSKPRAAARASRSQMSRRKHACGNLRSRV